MEFAQWLRTAAWAKSRAFSRPTISWPSSSIARPLGPVHLGPGDPAVDQHHDGARRVRRIGETTQVFGVYPGPIDTKMARP